MLNEEYFGLIDRVFNIIYFSKYIVNFSYGFYNEKRKAKGFDKAIKTYINNKYRHSISTIGLTKWGTPLLIIFFLASIGLLIIACWFIVT